MIITPSWASVSISSTPWCHLDPMPPGCSLLISPRLHVPLSYLRNVAPPLMLLPSRFAAWRLSALPGPMSTVVFPIFDVSRSPTRPILLRCGYLVIVAFYLRSDRSPHPRPPISLISIWRFPEAPPPRLSTSHLPTDLYLSRGRGSSAESVRVAPADCGILPAAKYIPGWKGRNFGRISAVNSRDSYRNTNPFQSGISPYCTTEPRRGNARRPIRPSAYYFAGRLR